MFNALYNVILLAGIPQRNFHNLYRASHPSALNIFHKFSVPAPSYVIISAVNKTQGLAITNFCKALFLLILENMYFLII